MPTIDPRAAARVLAELGRGRFALMAEHAGRRAGVLVRSVQWCADEPPLIAVAVRSGHWIDPLVRDSHVFAICRVKPAERLLMRKLAECTRPSDGDPFACLPSERLATGAPVLSRSELSLDCEVVRHFDLEADHELFIGLVRAIKLRGKPVIVLSSPQPRA
jgi:flavin reductase (DIM6/NTAB) family NADH-FMN oxidoreductase RutF